MSGFPAKRARASSACSRHKNGPHSTGILRSFRVTTILSQHKSSFIINLPFFRLAFPAPLASFAIGLLTLYLRLSILLSNPFVCDIPDDACQSQQGHISFFLNELIQRPLALLECALLIWTKQTEESTMVPPKICRVFHFYPLRFAFSSAIVGRSRGDGLARTGSIPAGRAPSIEHATAAPIKQSQ